MNPLLLFLRHLHGNGFISTRIEERIPRMQSHSYAVGQTRIPVEKVPYGEPEPGLNKKIWPLSSVAIKGKTGEGHISHRPG